MVNEPAPAGRPVGHSGTRVDINERPAWTMNGGVAFLIGLIAAVVGVALFYRDARTFLEVALPLVAVSILAFVVGVLFLTSLTIVNPGDTKVVQFFGRYVGTVRKTGLLMTLPLTTKKKVSVKVRNFETHELKVNDANGNPVNIAAIVVWQVADTAKSVFAVEQYEEFVAVQSEAALRHIATSYPYDNAGANQETLRGSTDLVARELAEEVSARIAIAGLEVVETRISSLAYAPEIAQAMLQRQQAAAVIASGTHVEGRRHHGPECARTTRGRTDRRPRRERKAAMVSNLLVVLSPNPAPPRRERREYT